VHHIQHFEKVIQVTNSWKRQSGKRISKCVNNKRTPPRATPPPEICLRAYMVQETRGAALLHTQWKICAPSEKWRAQFVEQQLNIYNCWRAAFIWYLFKRPTRKRLFFCARPLLRLRSPMQMSRPRGPRTPPPSAIARTDAVARGMQITTLVPTLAGGQKLSRKVFLG
jgi:hypothetical protein